MKDKGFTLIELIVTITLIVIISVTVGVSITGMLDRQEEKDTEDYVNQIQDAACVYAEINDISSNDTVSIGELIAAGLLDSSLKNPSNDNPITSYNNDRVSITWDNGEKTCTYDMLLFTAKIN